MQHNQNDNFYLQEAFTKLKLLKEDSFDLTVDRGVVDELKSFVADDIEAPYEEEIIDVDAETVDELQDSYLGKVVLQCSCCNTKIYKDPIDVIIDDELELANVEEECPVCSKALGWKVIGKIEPFDENQFEDNEEVEITDAEIEEALHETLKEDLDIHVEENSEGNLEVEVEAENDDVVIVEKDDEDNITDEIIDDVVEDDIVDESLKEDKNNLPDKLRINIELDGETDEEIEEYISDYLSNIYGFTHYGFKWEMLKPSGDILVTDIKWDLEESKKTCENCDKEHCECDDDHELDVDESCNKIEEELNDEFLNVEDVNIDVESSNEDDQKLEDDDKEPIKESVDLNEDIENLSLDTETTHMEMTSDDHGKVTVITEPRNVEEVEEVTDEMIAPLTDEEIVELDNNVPVEDTAEDEFEIDEFDEESFNELGESFLKRVYENVESFKTDNVKYENKSLVVEGLITFKSGKEKHSSFKFENFNTTKRNKILCNGLNEMFSKSKKAFILKGSLNEKKFISESLTYNYTAKSINENNDAEVVRIYGRTTIRNK